MSAQKAPRRGVVSAIAGLLGFSVLSGLLVTVMVAPAVAVTGITASSTIGIFDSLPEYLVIGQQPERNEIYANDNTAADGHRLIATIYDQNREEVAYDEISPFVLQAAVDGEDRRFFEHGGVDVSSVIRAAVGNVVKSDIESGASTLSMQLVKNINVQAALEQPTDELRKQKYKEATDTSFDRKLKEMKLAIGLEKKYTKKEILTAYLNIAFFGDNTYGIQAAAQRYYSVDAKDLTLPQATSLIAIVQYPGLRSLDDPEHFQANQDRRDVILYAMFDSGDITRAEYDEARNTPVDETTLLPSAPTSGCVAADIYARWFCDFVVKSVKDFAFLGADEAERQANWDKGGYTLYTTLDMQAQTAAVDATYIYAPNTVTDFQLGSATTGIEPGSGRVLVMAENKYFNDTLDSGLDPANSAVNFNTSFEYGGSTGFQSGSTYKLFTLLEWLIQGKGVNERVEGAGRTLKLSSFTDTCQPEVTSGPDYTFRNNSGSTGIWTIRAGTVSSINGVFFSMAQQLDLCAIHTLAADLGVERADGKPLSHLLSTIIGTNEISPISLAAAYSSVAAGGLACKPIIVDRAVGPSGTELGGQERDCHQGFSPDVANTAVDVLKGVMKGSASVGDGIPVFGKTGTTNDANQTWIVGSSSKITVVSWVGNIIGKKNILTVSYGGVRGEILRNMIMRATLQAYGAKVGGDDWPGPAPSLLNGSGSEVPDVRGQTAEGAKALLESLGFEFADGGQVDSELAVGKVVSTDPAAGSQSAKGATVTVFTSKGNKIAVPDVVGNGQTNDYGEAQGILSGGGFNNVAQACVVLTPTTAYPGPGGGLIDPLDPRINQAQSMSPAGGSYAVPTDLVTVTIGKASCP